MTKTKWYTKPIYVLFALALALSLSLVTAVPAGAQGTTIVLGGDIAPLANAQGSSAEQYIGSGSWQAIPDKMELYIVPTLAPFDSLGSFTIADIDSISYVTKNSGTPANVDFGLNIYTVPYDGGDEIWYGNRLSAEPLYSYSYNPTIGEWNTWNTDSGDNQLQFFDSKRTVAGFYTGPTLTELQAGSVDWGTYPNSGSAETIDYSSQTVGFIVLVTSTGGNWEGFDGFLDAITISLNGGASVTIDLEEYYAEVWVDDVALPGHFVTIQAGVNAVAESGIVNVAAGTYDEMVTITKSVTLRGANWGVHPAVGTHLTETVGTPGAESVITHAWYAFQLQADDITIDGFKFTGETGGEGNIIRTYEDGNNFHLTNCIFDVSRRAVTKGWVLFGDGSHNDVLIDFNLFEDVQGDATLYFGGGSPSYDRLRIAYNRFNCGGDSIFWATDTPLVDGIIEGNEFDGTIDEVPGAGGTGLNIGKGGNIIIRNNWFHDMSYAGFQVGIVGGSVIGNTFEDTYPILWNGEWYASNAFELWGGEWGTSVSTDVTIAGNTIKFNNQSNDADEHGIRLHPGNEDPIYPLTLGVDAPNIHINGNTFVDGGVSATALAVRNQGTGIVDAEYNWWDDASGPYHLTNPDGLGGAVSDDVDFMPWYATETTTPERQYVTVKVGDTEEVRAYSDTIRGGIGAASSGDTILVAPGTYEENVTIDKTLTLQSTEIHEANIKGTVTIGGAHVDPSNAVLEGFDIQGGVHIWDHDGVTVAYNKITASGSNGICYTHGSSTGGTVTHNVVSAPGKMGICLDHDGGTFTVTHNTVEARKAIMFGTLSGGVIEYNTISSPSSDCDIEVWDASIVTANYNNLAGEVWNSDNPEKEWTVGDTLDATLNWWGNPNGPSAAAHDGVVDYSPWLPGNWELFYDSEGNLIDTDGDTFYDLEEYWLGTEFDNPDSKPGAAIDPGQVDNAYVAGDDQANLQDSEGGTIADIDISGGGDGSGTITGARYTDDPGETSLSVGTGTSGVVFLDVRVTGYTEGIAHITVPYPDEVEPFGIVDDTNIVETTLSLYYWDDAANMWLIADNNVVDPDANTVSGDIPITALTGTPIGGGGYLADEAIVAIESILNLSYSGEDTVKLTIDTNTAFLGAATIDLTFDPRVVEVLAVKKGAFDTLTVNLSYAVIGSDTQIARFVAHQAGADGVDATDGALVAEVKLIAVGSTMDESPLSLYVDTLKDNKGDIIPFTLGANDSIAIVGGIGDANRDGVVDVFDCVYIARAIASFPGWSIDTPTMDVDGDGGVDAYDCTYLARHIALIAGYEQLGG